MLRGIPSRESVKESLSEKSQGVELLAVAYMIKRTDVIAKLVDIVRFKNPVSITAPTVASFATRDTWQEFLCHELKRSKQSEGADHAFQPQPCYEGPCVLINSRRQDTGHTPMR
jgi:hypothetical protein